MCVCLCTPSRVFWTNLWVILFYFVHRYRHMYLCNVLDVLHAWVVVRQRPTNNEHWRVPMWRAVKRERAPEHLCAISVGCLEINLNCLPTREILSSRVVGADAVAHTYTRTHRIGVQTVSQVVSEYKYLCMCTLYTSTASCVIKKSRKRIVFKCAQLGRMGKSVPMYI